MKFMDSFAIPYTLVFGNHDCEMGSTCNKEELAQIGSLDKKYKELEKLKDNWEKEISDIRALKEQYTRLLDGMKKLKKFR